MTLPWFAVNQKENTPPEWAAAPAVFLLLAVTAH